ncbi:MAG: T9SS type A sorting domain-containing protein [Flavobacteriales bacterium]|nr:T9SS type A sorting domain-containing protein [Flavobacteriales bacterium]
MHRCERRRHHTLTLTNAEGCTSTCTITVTTTPPPVCTITGNTSFCVGSLNKLCGPEFATSYLWSTGATTECIYVSAAGTYTLTLTNAEGCTSTCTITVTTTPPPVCTILAMTPFCEGTLNKLCGPQYATSYLWSTGETTECIDVSAAGTYTLTVTNAEGCTSTCTITVTTTPPPVCLISVDLVCQPGTTRLCAPAGAYSYLWNTGATTACIEVTTGGIYSVVVSSAPGCTSTCSIAVTSTPGPDCVIIGNTTFCEGQPNKLCGTPGAAGYLWSTGETTECIYVNASGIYSVTVTNADGCSSDCILTVTMVQPIAPDGIMGPIAVANNQAVSYSIDPITGATAYEWTLPQGWTGDTTGTTINVITDGASSTDEICVQALFGQCPGPDTCLTVSFITGIVDADGSAWFTILPNPSHGGFQVVPTGRDHGPIKIIVFDVLGQLVVAPQVLSGTQATMIHMEHEADGVYFLRASSGDEDRVFELMIQK